MLKYIVYAFVVSIFFVLDELWQKISYNSDIEKSIKMIPNQLLFQNKFYPTRR